ncbi:hypothetical protein CRG98_049189, partial [Punica granatum]
MLRCKDMHVRGGRCTGGRLSCAGARAREARGWTRRRAAVRAGAQLCARVRGWMRECARLQ